MTEEAAQIGPASLTAIGPEAEEPRQRRVMERKVKPVDQVVATGLADELSSRLAEAILEGEYRPGDRIVQDEICARYGVSRTPVREALRKLQAQNLVVVIPNKGATVRIPTKDDLQEGWAIRGELEGFAAELACVNLTDDILATLNRAQESIEAAAKAIESSDVDPDELLRLHSQMRSGNEEFHATLLRAAQNEQLRTLCESLQSYLPKDYAWRATLASKAEHILYVDQHRAVYNALAQRDQTTARTEMRAHLLLARDLLIVYLTEHGFWK